jgi:hypothetical protein
MSAPTVAPVKVSARAMYIESGNYLVSFQEDYDLVSDDALGNPSAVRVEMPCDDISCTDTVLVDPADGDSLEAVRRAIEALTIVRDQLEAIDRRNRGI